MLKQPIAIENEVTLSPEVDELVQWIRGADHLQVVSAVLLLAELGAEAAGAVPELQAALAPNRAREVRWAAAYALGRIGSAASSAHEALLRATQDVDTDVRDEALKALGCILADSADPCGTRD